MNFKKILSLVLVFCMCLSLFPAGAFANWDEAEEVLVVEDEEEYYEPAEEALPEEVDSPGNPLRKNPQRNRRRSLPRSLLPIWKRLIPSRRLPMLRRLAALTTPRSPLLSIMPHLVPMFTSRFLQLLRAPR